MSKCRSQSWAAPCRRRRRRNRPGRRRLPRNRSAGVVTRFEHHRGPAVPIHPPRRPSSGIRLTDRSVANIVKSHAERVGLDPALFSGHSLRAGFLTSAAKRGASIFKMMATSRHRSTASLVGYVRDQELFVDHAGAGLL